MAAACPQGFGVGRAAAPRAATRSGALGVAGENRTELGDRTGGGIGSSGGHDGDRSQNSGVPAGAVLSKKAPGIRTTRGGAAALPLAGRLRGCRRKAGTFGAGRIGLSGRGRGMAWLLLHRLGAGSSGIIAVPAGRWSHRGRHSRHEWQDAEGQDRMAAALAAMCDFRAGRRKPKATTRTPLETRIRVCVGSSKVSAMRANPGGITSPRSVALAASADVPRRAAAARAARPMPKARERGRRKAGHSRNTTWSERPDRPPRSAQASASRIMGR